MANNDVLNNYNSLYDQLYAKFKPANTYSYTPQSDSALKDSLQKVLRPDYDKQIQAVQRQTREHKANIDADAAARGIGSSSWVTDVKNRADQSETQNLRGIESDYLSALYSALINRKNAQDEMALNAAQLAQNAEQAAQGNAMSLAGQLYDRVYKEEASGGGGGGGYSRSRTPDTPPQGLYQDALTKLKKQGYTTKSAVDFLKTGNTNLQKVQATKVQPTKKKTGGGNNISTITAR